jgi:hypothetical protein
VLTICHIPHYHPASPFPQTLPYGCDLAGEETELQRGFVGAQGHTATPWRRNENQADLVTQNGRLPIGWEGAHQGNPGPHHPLPPQLAPEHTLMSFRKALEQKLYGLQADITIR